jgi:hypothetical protein
MGEIRGKDGIYYQDTEGFLLKREIRTLTLEVFRRRFYTPLI